MQGRQRALAPLSNPWLTAPHMAHTADAHAQPLPHHPPLQGNCGSAARAGAGWSLTFTGGAIGWWAAGACLEAGWIAESDAQRLWLEQRAETTNPTCTADGAICSAGEEPETTVQLIRRRTDAGCFVAMATAPPWRIPARPGVQLRSQGLPPGCKETVGYHLGLSPILASSRRCAKRRHAAAAIPAVAAAPASICGLLPQEGGSELMDSDGCCWPDGGESSFAGAP